MLFKNDKRQAWTFQGGPERLLKKLHRDQTQGDTSALEEFEEIETTKD